MADPVIEEGTETPAAPAAEEKPPSIDDRLGAIVDKFTSQADAEETAPEKPAAEAAPAKAEAKPDGSEAKPGETPAQPGKIVATDEQLADPAFWGSLQTAEQWQAMERDYPVETRHVKAAQAAASRIVNAARKDAAATPPPKRDDATPSDEEFSPEYLEAIELSQSLDVKEAAKGRRLLAKFDAAVIAKEIGIDPEQSKADAVAQTAYRAALEQAADFGVPELAKYDMLELAKIVEADPALKYLVEVVGTPEAITSAMLSSAKTYKEQKAAAATKAAADKAAADAKAAEAAAAAKKKDTQRIVQSNARPASGDALKPHGASPTTMTLDERLNARFDKEVARQGG